MEPTGGTSRAPDPDQGCPDHVRWSFGSFSGLVLAVSSHFVDISSHRKSENRPPEMTVERAVSLLGSEDEDTLLCAAGHLQTQCFRSADAKKSVRSESFSQ